MCKYDGAAVNLSFSFLSNTKKTLTTFHYKFINNTSINTNEINKKVKSKIN
jgi:hypothetical protein